MCGAFITELILIATSSGPSHSKSNLQMVRDSSAWEEEAIDPVMKVKQKNLFSPRSLGFSPGAEHFCRPRERGSHPTLVPQEHGT